MASGTTFRCRGQAARQCTKPSHPGGGWRARRRVVYEEVWDGQRPRGLQVEGAIRHPRARLESVSLLRALLRGMVRRPRDLVFADLFLWQHLAALTWPGRRCARPCTRDKLRWPAVRWLRREGRRHRSGFLISHDAVRRWSAQRLPPVDSDSVKGREGASPEWPRPLA